MHELSSECERSNYTNEENDFMTELYNSRFRRFFGDEYVDSILWMSLMKEETKKPIDVLREIQEKIDNK